MKHAHRRGGDRVYRRGPQGTTVSKLDRGGCMSRFSSSEAANAAAGASGGGTRGGTREGQRARAGAGVGGDDPPAGDWQPGWARGEAGVSRARITQVMAVLGAPGPVLEAIRRVEDGGATVTESIWRRASIADGRQRRRAGLGGEVVGFRPAPNRGRKERESGGPGEIADSCSRRQPVCLRYTDHPSPT